jgi:hypothetical protein
MKMQTYDIAAGWKDLSAGEQERVINLASIDELRKWSNDPACNQRSFVGTRLEWAQKGYTPPKPCGCSPDQICQKCREVPKALPKPLGVDTGGPFSPRVDISADARYISGRIVKHLWIIFVAVPFVLAVLFLMLRS